MPTASASVRPTPSNAGYVKFSNKLEESLNDIAGMVQQHRQMIDSIQEVALELTAAIGSLHGITVKYARTANQILDLILPIIQNLPLIPKSARQLLGDLEKWTQKIIDNESQTARTINEVHSSLRNGDVNKLKVHAAELQSVTRTITGLVQAGT